MTASHNTEPTPPPFRQTEPGSSDLSVLAAEEIMQRQDPAAQPGASSTGVHDADTKPAAQRNDSDPAAKNDEYEVVEVEDDVEEVEEVQRVERPTRPPLPRLNSQSRASSLMGTGIVAQKEIKTGPVHVKDTREIPIPLPKKQAAPPTAPKALPSHLKDTREAPIPSLPKKQAAPPPPPPPTIPKALPSPTESIHSDQSGQSDDSYSEDEQQQSYPQIGGGLKMDDTRGPNPKIQIPKVTPVSSGFTLPPNLSQLATGLEGKYVDEFGNILDWNGQVLGRAEGDLPSMIGRPVSATGEILSEDDEVVGYVAENDTIPPTPPSPRPIEGMGGGLKVDHMGNIIDSKGSVVGHFNAAPLTHSMERTGKSKPSNDHGQAQNCTCSGHSKPSSVPHPSEIYLDVKSTTDGIQLIIKIPTVFNAGGPPTVHIGQG